jgi:hypothetical protein
VAGQHIQVDLNGTYTGPGSPTGVLGVLDAASVGFLLLPLFWRLSPPARPSAGDVHRGSAASSSSG